MQFHCMWQMGMQISWEAKVGALNKDKRLHDAPGTEETTWTEPRSLYGSASGSDGFYWELANESLADPGPTVAQCQPCKDFNPVAVRSA